MLFFRKNFFILFLCFTLSGVSQAAYQPLLPDHRIVAYYGNFYSPRMGILGEYDREEVLRRLMVEVENWEKADPQTPVIPAIEYIAIVAQHSPGADGLYRSRMPDAHIQKALSMAEEIDGIVILDVQVGWSNLEDEVEHLIPYLELPNVMLAIDPEFDMYDNFKPGTRIGTTDAKEINQVIRTLAQIVKENKLPPKVLIIHRFTQRMVTNAQDIKPLPEVQVVMDMDGWGPQALKKNTYKHFIASEPVQFTGFKLFYKHDTRNGSKLFTPEQILQLNPVPVFIMYQ